MVGHTTYLWLFFLLPLFSSPDLGFCRLFFWKEPLPRRRQAAHLSASLPFCPHAPPPHPSTTTLPPLLTTPCIWTDKWTVDFLYGSFCLAHTHTYIVVWMGLGQGRTGFFPVWFLSLLCACLAMPACTHATCLPACCLPAFVHVCLLLHAFALPLCPFSSSSCTLPYSAATSFAFATFALSHFLPSCTCLAFMCLPPFCACLPAFTHCTHTATMPCLCLAMLL